jgi:hypothetical protein
VIQAWLVSPCICKPMLLKNVYFINKACFLILIWFPHILKILEQLIGFNQIYKYERIILSRAIMLT